MSENNQEEDDDVPKDTGWSWVVCFSVFASLMLVEGHLRSLSALFLDITEEFDQSITMVSLTFSLSSLSAAISTLVSSNIIIRFFNAREICCIAGFFNSLCTIVASFAPNMATWLLVYTIKGLLYGVFFNLPISQIGFYFKKKRGLASSIGSVGLVIGYIGFPPLAIFLRESLGLRGALLVLGAIETHYVPLSLLLRPPSSYRNKIRTKNKEENDMKSFTNSNKDSNCSDPLLSINEHKQDNATPVMTISGSPSKHGDVILPGHHDYIVSSQPTGYEGTQRLDMSSHSKDFTTSNNLTENPGVDETSQPVPTNQTHLPVHSGIDAKDPMTEIENRDFDSNHGDDTCNHNRDNIDHHDYDGTNGEITLHKLCRLETFVDTTLFRLWIVRSNLLAGALSSFTAFLSIYMPVVAMRAGIGKADAALLMTVLGSVDFFSRLFVGWLADQNIVTHEKMVSIGLSLIIVMTQFVRFFTTYSLFVMFAVLVGMFAGVRPALQNTMLLEYLSPEKAGKAFGLSCTLIVFTLSINHPIIGFMSDATGSFVVPFHVVGCVLVLSVVLYLMAPIFLRWDKERSAKEKVGAQDKGKEVSRFGRRHGREEKTQCLNEIELK